MITLNQIREVIKNQDEELKDIIIKYFEQVHLHKTEKIRDEILDINLYKKSVKKNIERLISENNLSDAKELLDEYKNIVKDDVSIYSIEGIILLHENDIFGAYNSFECGINLDKTNIDLLYNMGYTNILLGNTSEGINYYNQCLSLTEDQSLVNEINKIINQLIKRNDHNYTFITLGVNDKDIIFDKLKKDGNNILKIIENNQLDYENKYEHDEMTIYEINCNKYNEILEYIIRRNENCIVICGDINKLDIIKKLKDKCKVLYYTNKNLYTDQSNYLNHSIDMYLDKEICNNCDLVITNNINVYNSKKIIERRDNIYLIAEDESEIFDIKDILGDDTSIDKKKLESILKEKIKKIEGEYEKALYLLASECENIEVCLDIAKYIYDKYKTEEMYQIYLSLLNENKDYINLSAVAIMSEYCSDIFKAELIYLNSIEDYDLMDFIASISIKNYKNLELMSSKSLEYKMSTYNFELNKFNVAYSRYINLLNDKSNLINSPLVNRNVGYLMYISGNDEYKTFYNLYNEIIECLYKN